MRCANSQASLEKTIGRPSRVRRTSGTTAPRGCVRAAGAQLVLYEPPFAVDDTPPPVPPRFAAYVAELVAANRRADAVRAFMTTGVQNLRVFVAMVCLMPMWKAAEDHRTHAALRPDANGGHVERHAAARRPLERDHRADAHPRWRQEPGLAAQRGCPAGRAGKDRRDAPPRGGFRVRAPTWGTRPARREGSWRSPRSGRGCARQRSPRPLRARRACARSAPGRRPPRSPPIRVPA